MNSIWSSTLGKGTLGQARCAKSAFHHNAFVEDFRRGLREQLNREAGWQIALTGVAQDLLIRMARGHCVVREAFESNSVAAVRGSIEYLDQHFNEAHRRHGGTLRSLAATFYSLIQSADRPNL